MANTASDVSLGLSKVRQLHRAIHEHSPLEAGQCPATSVWHTSLGAGQELNASHFNMDGGGLTSCKYDKQPNYDQGVYASNHQPETNSGQDALRLEPDLLAEHGVSDANAQPQ